MNILGKILVFLPLLLLASNLFGATVFSEFYCLSTGTNINAGSTTGAVTYTTTNGAWSTVTGGFTPTDGTTPASTVSSGMWASVFIDAATVGVYIGRITNVAAGANGVILIDQTTGAGSPPTTSANTRTIRVGGAWFGPNAASGFPLTLANLNRLTNTIPDRPRINIKNDRTYNMTAAITASAAGPYSIQGYTTTPGDGGKFTLSGDVVAGAYVPLSLQGVLVYMGDFIISSNGNSSAASAGLVGSGNFQVFERGVVKSIRGSGFFLQGGGQTLLECESYSNGVGNTVLDAGFKTGSGSDTTFKRCISHDNNTANCAGFHIGPGSSLSECISESNGTNGLTVALGSTSGIEIFQSEFYNNGGNGIEFKGTGAGQVSTIVENCNFFNNALFAFSSLANGSNFTGIIQYCAFGTGTAANVSGTNSATGWGAVQIRDETFIAYAANTTPWLAPSTGDFRISNNQGWGSGRGTYTETQAGYTGTIGYPDIGAAQHRGVTNATAAAFAQ